MKPTISIIVPVYNLEDYIGKCLESILSQTFRKFEIIVVNDGSTDGSGEICDKYARKDMRVKVVHKKYGGVSSARNIGITLAKGEYIGFVDGDDYIDTEMYKILHELCVETGSDIAICNLGREINGRRINNTESKPLIKEMHTEEAMRELFKGLLYRFSLCNKLFKRNCFEGIRFPEGRIHEDLATTYKLVAKASKVVYINYPGYIYVKRKNSILTSNYYEKRLDALKGWDEILPFMDKMFPQLANEVINCFTYNCVDHFYYIVNQVDDRRVRKKFLKRIRSCIRKHYRDIQDNASLTLTYRIIIYGINYHIGLLVLVNRLKNIRGNYVS